MESSLGVTDIGVTCREPLRGRDLCSDQRTTAGGRPSFPVCLPDLTLLPILCEDLLCPQEEDGGTSLSALSGGHGTGLAVQSHVQAPPGSSWNSIIFIPGSVPSISQPVALLSPNHWKFPPPRPSTFPPLNLRALHSFLFMIQSITFFKSNHQVKKKTPHVGSHWLCLLADVLSFLAFRHFS